MVTESQVFFHTQFVRPCLDLDLRLHWALYHQWLQSINRSTTVLPSTCYAFRSCCARYSHRKEKECKGGTIVSWSLLLVSGCWGDNRPPLNIFTTLSLSSIMTKRSALPVLFTQTAHKPARIPSKWFNLMYWWTIWRFHRGSLLV